MTYVHTNGVDPTKPTGADAANVDDDMRDIKLAYNERFDDFFGTNWANDDPIEPTKIGSAINISGSQVYTAIYDAGNGGSSIVLDWDNGDQQRVTLNSATCSITFSNIRAGSTYLLYIQQDGTGGRVCSLPTTIRTTGGGNFNAGSLSVTPNRVSIISLTAWNTSILIGNLVGTGINVA